MVKACKNRHAARITLESTITAHSFYQRQGFRDTGPMTTVVIADTPIRCYAMELIL